MVDTSESEMADIINETFTELIVQWVEQMCWNILPESSLPCENMNLMGT